MIIAVEGCAHGQLEEIYHSIENLEGQKNVKVDLLICCGDFQTLRNENDLECIARPEWYRDIGTFYKYYSGELKAPILTIFIGGNHEASNYLQELAYGGWVAPNIYYLGYAGVVQFGGVRIGGISGIFKGYDFQKGHFESPPYNPETLRSVYHIRNLEVFRLKQLKKDVDIFLSHDWPQGINNYGDTEKLLELKPHFKDEIDKNELGSPPGRSLLHELKPKHWFAAHMHCRFVATVQHDEVQKTEFLSLDKCLEGYSFLEFIEIAHDPCQDLNLCYDPQWLAILQSTNHLLSVLPHKQYMPRDGPRCTGRWDFHPTEDELEKVREIFGNDYKIPLNFVPTVEPFNPRPNYSSNAHQPQPQLNPQTTEFCNKLGIDDPLEKLIRKNICSWRQAPRNRTH